MHSKQAELREKCTLLRERIFKYKQIIDERKPGFTLKQATLKLPSLQISLLHKKKFINLQNEEGILKRTTSKKGDKPPVTPVLGVCFGGTQAFANQLAIADSAGKVALLDITKKKKIVEHAEAAKGALNAIAIDPKESRLLAAGGIDQRVLLYSINPIAKKREKVDLMAKLTELTGHNGPITSLAFLDNQYMITASRDSTLLLWNVNKHGYLMSYSDHGGDVNSVDICSVNRNIIVSGSVDTAVRVWDIRMKVQCVKSFEGRETAVSCVRFLPGTQLTIAAGHENSSVKLYDIRALSPVAEFKEQNTFQNVTSLAFSPSGRILFTSYAHSSILVWDVLKEEKAFALEDGHDEMIHALAMDPTGKSLASVGKDGYTIVWE